MTPMGTRWTVRSPQELLWRTWGTDSLLFDPKSGDTHFLDEVARQGLLCLQDAPLNVDELKDRLAERLDVDADSDLASYVKLLIERFNTVGLIESLP